MHSEVIAESWGRYPKAKQAGAALFWRQDALPAISDGQTVLPFGLGRSYGDSCLNDGNAVLFTRGLDRWLEFDLETGLVTAEAGVSLAEMLELCVPRGFFLPVSPGTKHVTLGGAIANDVHGKNHHSAGTFGRFVLAFELLRSDGQRLRCTPTQNAELYAATIGGLGLTGLIVSATVQLQRIQGPWINAEAIPFHGVDEFLARSDESEKDFAYSVAWFDCLASGKNLGRGVFFRGNHAPDEAMTPVIAPKQLAIVPFSLPDITLNGLTVRAFNFAYFRVPRPSGPTRVHYEPFFYPLDRVGEWNRIYGKSGFLQYQCVVPRTDGNEALTTLLREISRSGVGSFLAVLKTFGNIPSPGMMSFPRPGITLALDFPQRGQRVFSLFERLDRVVREAGGAVYPAKDARMSADSFDAFFPRWREFARYIDPRFSSSFWRRVTRQG